MKLKYILGVVEISASVLLPATTWGANCPTTHLNAPCIEVHNSGTSEEISVSIQTTSESSIKISPGIQVSYLFPSLENFNSFILEAISNVNDLDSSCTAYPWAVKLKEGKPYTVNNLTNIIYSYSYGLEENEQGFKLVNCS